MSRQKIDDSTPHEIILISFSMREVLQERYYNLGYMTGYDKYLVQTRLQANTSGVNVPEVHEIEKSLVLHVKPEWQKVVKLLTDKRLPIPKPRIRQGRSRIRRKQGYLCHQPQWLDVLVVLFFPEGFHMYHSHTMEHHLMGSPQWR